MDTNSLRKTKIAENVPGMIYTFLLTPDGKMSFTFASQQCLEIFELEPRTLENDPEILEKIVHSDELLALNEKILLSKNHLTPFEWDGRIVTRSGKIKRAWVRSTPEKQPDDSVEWNGILMDVTEKFNRMEELEQTNLELKMAQARLEEIANNAPGVIFEWKLFSSGDERIDYVGPKVDRLLSFRPQSLHEIEQLIHPDDISNWQSSIQKAISGDGLWSFEGRLVDKSGRYKWWQGYATRHTDEGKSKKTYHGQIVDVDEKKTQEFNERSLRRKFEI